MSWMDQVKTVRHPQPQRQPGRDELLADRLAAALPKLPERDRPFACSLLGGFDRYRSFTDRQRPHVERLIDRATNPASTRLDALHEVLQRHSSFHVGDLTITRRERDQLCWIKHKDAAKVVGKIDHGVLALWQRPGVDLNAVRALLDELNSAPLQAAMKYGRLSGRCCSCGRELTDPESIATGIGPVCAERFAS